MQKISQKICPVCGGRNLEPLSGNMVRCGHCYNTYELEQKNDEIDIVSDEMSFIDSLHFKYGNDKLAEQKTAFNSSNQTTGFTKKTDANEEAMINQVIVWLNQSNFSAAELFCKGILEKNPNSAAARLYLLYANDGICNDEQFISDYAYKNDLQPLDEILKICEEKATYDKIMSLANGIYSKAVENEDIEAMQTALDFLQSWDVQKSNNITSKQYSDKTNYVVPFGATEIKAWQFDSRNDLTDIVIPESVMTIGKFAFTYCDNLSSVVIPDSVTKIDGYAFAKCAKLKTIYCIARSMPEDWDEDWNSNCEAEVLWGNDGRNRKATVEIESTQSRSIPYDYNNDERKSQKTIQYERIPANIISTDSSAPTHSIQNNTVKSDYTVPDGTTEINFEQFYKKHDLVSVNLPDSVKTIHHHAFSKCKNLTNLNLGNGLQKIESFAFLGCISLSNFELPDSITAIDTCAFYECESIKKIKIPNSITRIEDQTFVFCKKLEQVTIPTSVTYIGNGAFSYCINLTDIYYEGTTAQWLLIKKRSPLINLLLHEKWDHKTGEYTIHCTDGFLLKHPYK